MIKDLDAKNTESKIIKENLAYAYQILSYLKLDDHTYTHLSARSEKGFYIYPFGLLFSEVRAENLLEVTLDGEILTGCEYQYNRTGYIIHGEIYKKRLDINAIFHIHTPEIVAISAHKNGMMPASQWALHFYNRIAYHKYDSLALNSQQGAKIAQDLKDYFVMLMRNHGSITCGRTIQEALFYTYHLQQACKTQCMLQSKSDVIMPSHEVATNAVADLLSFEQNLGQRDWQAWLRLINTAEISQQVILAQLKAREPIFHHPEKFGKTKQDIEAQMCDEFWEVGASGRVYTKQDVIETLLERYNNHYTCDIWEAKDFTLTKIAPDNYLLTYILVQDKTRVTRRSTIWRRVNGDWKILFHQGTVINAGKE